LALVDYAHTPDALTAVLSSLHPDAGGKIVVVMGSGGDRDSTKRTAMGEVTARLADMVIVTDDNPRLESPEKIRAAILSGAERVAEGERALIEEVPGRAFAIARAVALAQPGDIVIVAGKGHEQGQEIDGHVDAFDDRAVLLEALRKRLDSGGGVGGASANPEDHRRPEEER
jgi:UDP-N-acetylmuramoyl-L-alanyl-D-glutamate--2,6-diaminopimelate ligase